MDLLRTILIYMSMVFVSAVQSAPEPALMPELNAPSQTAYVEASATPTLVPTPSPTPVPTPDITPNTDYKTIRVGDNGDEVRNMQQKLADLGYYAGDVDGRFGNQTRRAVEKFQYNNGLDSDGIAGKNTLTVLFEYKDVRSAPVEVTPTPANGGVTAAATGNDGITIPTFMPIETSGLPIAPTESATIAALATTVKPVVTPSATVTAMPSPTPTATPLPEFLPMEGFTIAIAGKEDDPLLTSTLAVQGKENKPLVPYSYGDILYVPFLTLLERASVVLVPSDNLELKEYAFALKDDIYRLTFTEDQSGSPTDLQVYKNNEPQILPIRDVRAVDELYYLPTTSMESLTGVVLTMDAAAHRLVMTLPSAK
ncbi:MAG: peptidoglycan-binding domain-containing protein [Clostridia bacterium]